MYVPPIKEEKKPETYEDAMKMFETKSKVED
jgi:hypothetical protein